MASSQASTETTTLFLAPAGESFESLLDQGVFYLNNYSSKWKTCQSYLIPPIFYYKLPELGDEIVEKEAESGMDPDSIVKHRQSDNAEHIVYDAISGISQEEMRSLVNGKDTKLAPFIAIHDLNISNIRHQLGKIFPHLTLTHLQEILAQCFRKQLKNLDADCQNMDLRKMKIDLENDFRAILEETFPDVRCEKLEKVLETAFQNKLENAFRQQCWKEIKVVLGGYFRQYDFLLIGPKIGLIAIEVKGSHFKLEKHFSPKFKTWPCQYEEGIQQVESIDNFLQLLSECTGMEMPMGVKVRKILFTPNLSKSRFEDWMETLDEDYKRNIQDRLKAGNIIQWFQENMANSGSDHKMPPLYSCLKRELERCACNLTENLEGNYIQEQLDSITDFYQTYGPILSALKSTTILASPTDKSCVIHLEESIFSKSKAILNEDCRIANQNPLEGRKSSKGKKVKMSERSCLKEKPDDLHCMVAYMTPDQMRALAGPSRQFIKGVAGTGKSLILEIKAIQILKRGEKVLILTQDCSIDRYRNLLEDHKFDKSKYLITSWSVKLQILHCLISTKYPDIAATHRITQETYLKLKNEPDAGLILDWFKDYDHLLIDDGFDESDLRLQNRRRSFIVCSVLMAFAEKLYPSKTVWVAIDPYADFIYQPWHQAFRDETEKSSEIDHHLLFVANCQDYQVTDLHQVMRCSGNIFRVLYQNSKAIDCLLGGKSSIEHKLLGERPSVEHKILGPTPVLVQEQKELFNDAVQTMLTNIRAELETLLEKNGDLSQIVIIPAHYPIIEDAQVFLLEECQKMIDSMRPNLADENLPHIRKWHDVSSLEWPVVIYAECRYSGADVTFFRRYRAKSRARTQLIQIITKYGPASEVSDGQEFAHKSSADLVGELARCVMDESLENKHSTEAGNACSDFGQTVQAKLQGIDNRTRGFLENRILELIDHVVNM